MADVLTHYTTGRLLWFVWTKPTTRVLFYFGVCLPDILQKFLNTLTQTPYNFTMPTHSIFGLLLYCYIISFLFEEDFRSYAFIALYLGSLLHVLADLFRGYVGIGMPILTPFSIKGYEFDIYVNEEILFMIPVNIFIILLLEFYTKRPRRNVF
jgi:hypothetical protein